MNNAVHTELATKSRQFFSINATYLIDPSSSQVDLQNDIGCLLDAIEAAAQTVIDGLSDPGSDMVANLKDAVALLYGTLYQIRMVRGIASSLEVRS